MVMLIISTPDDEAKKNGGRLGYRDMSHSLEAGQSYKKT